MKNILKFILLIFVCGFFSCNDELNEVSNEAQSDIKNIDLAKNYLNFLRAKKEDGSVLIQSSTTNAMQDINKNITFAEKTLRTKISKSSNKKIEIQGHDIAKDSKRMKNHANDDDNYFGRVLSYRVVDNSDSHIGSSKTNTINEFYIPKLIEVSYSTDKLEPGTIVSWNIDNLNENGVIVSVEYYAINQLDTKLAFNNSSTIKRSFVLDDFKGSYTITQEDLEIFPNKALLDINILRAGFDTDESSNVSIAGLTKVGDTKLAEY